MRSDRDYIISKIRAGRGWLYSCFSPAVTDAEYKSAIKIHYQVGEPVPARRRYLCTRHDIESAKTACMRHLEQSE